jgi:spore maturation protein CgeB
VRALVVQPGPFFSVADVHDGWVAALRQLGVEVVDFNFHDRLMFYAEARFDRGDEQFHKLTDMEAVMLASKGIEAACYEVWPDVVVVVSGFFVPPASLELIRMRGTKIVIIHTEAPYEDDRQLRRAGLADLNLLNDPTNLDQFQQIAPTYYQAHCYDPAKHFPRDPDPDLACDFSFVGTGYPSRVEFLEKVDWDGLDVRLAGNWQKLAEDSILRPWVQHPLAQCCPNDETVRLYTSSKCSANLYRKEADAGHNQGWSCGPREIELAACGVPFVREARGESDALFPFLPSVSSPEEFGDAVRWLCADEARRHDLGARARAAVADRTFVASAARLLAELF